MALYDPRGRENRALIVAVSEYDHKGRAGGVPGNLPTVQDNRTGLEDVLHRGGVFGEGQISVCASPTLDGFDGALRRAAQKADGLLLFYFAGHGILSADGSELYLQMRTARVVHGASRAFPGAVSITSVLNELAGSEAERIVVVLDCCYAGSAAKAWQEMPPYRRRKVLLLMSVQPKRAITPSDGGKGTPFTRELVRLLEQKGQLTLLSLYSRLQEAMTERKVPTVSSGPKEPQEPQAVWDPGQDVLLRPGPARSDDGSQGTGGAGGNWLLRLPRSRRNALVGIACLALCAGVLAGLKIIGDGGGGGGENVSSKPTASSSPAASSSTTPFSGPGGGAGEKGLARLKAARAGGLWKVGVKRGQPGLSEEVREGEWRGREIEYAKVILGKLRIKNFKFVGVGTDNRARELEHWNLDMIVGTYGISPDRKNGTSEYPAVIFAGPYFKTEQKVMLEHYPGSSVLNEARIRGVRTVVKSINNVPRDARVCVVKGSSADLYLRKDKARQGHVESLADYGDCIEKLDDVYDAVLTDEVILRNFTKGGKYFIATDSFAEPEEYGIGINAKNGHLKAEVCEAMRVTLTQRNKIYGSLGGADYAPLDLKECQPPTTP
ncbi:caspase family protein [Streptomyces sp. NPDC002073]